MGSVLKIVYVVLLAITFIVVAAQGDDVYNFYFQKAPGPTTVIQGGGTPQPQSVMVNKEGEVIQTAPVAVAPATPTMATAVAPVVVATQEEKKWEIQLGLASRPFSFVEARPTQNAFFSQGYAFTVGYNFSKYFGLSLQLEYAKSYNFSNNPSLIRKNPLDGALYARITPLHVQMFGHDFIELGFNAGMMTVTTSVAFPYMYNANIDFFAYTDGNDISEMKSVTGFVGPALAVNINPSFAITADWKLLTENPSYRTWTANARVRF